MFNKNQKVVCVNAEKGWLSKESLLIENRVYIVNTMCNNGKDVMLKEVSGGWDKSRFRPLVDEWVENVICQSQPCKEI